ncbi:MAG: DUF6879 family protein [Acidimicrobiia bacterium]
MTSSRARPSASCSGLSGTRRGVWRPGASTRDPEEDDALARYLAGSPEDPDYLASRDYWLGGTIRTAVDAGRRFARVRVVPEPLTPYLRFGLYHCRFNVEAGEAAPAHLASMPCTKPSEGPSPPHKSAINRTQRCTGTCW